MASDAMLAQIYCTLERAARQCAQPILSFAALVCGLPCAQVVLSMRSLCTYTQPLYSCMLHMCMQAPVPCIVCAPFFATELIHHGRPLSQIPDHIPKLPSYSTVVLLPRRAHHRAPRHAFHLRLFIGPFRRDFHHWCDRLQPQGHRGQVCGVHASPVALVGPSTTRHSLHARPSAP